MICVYSLYEITFGYHSNVNNHSFLAVDKMLLSQLTETNK